MASQRLSYPDDLRHAKSAITLDVYDHLISSMQAEAAQRIDEWITPVELIQLHQTAPELHQEMVDR